MQIAADDLRHIERLHVRAWPAFETANIHGWLWRYSGGASQRANSVSTVNFTGDPAAGGPSAGSPSFGSPSSGAPSSGTPSSGTLSSGTPSSHGPSSRYSAEQLGDISDFWGDFIPMGERPAMVTRPDALLDQLDPPPLAHDGRPIVDVLRGAYLAMPGE